MNILVTGGCGFIGSHLVDKLVEYGHKVRVLDCLENQVHLGKKPPFLNQNAEYIYADIRDSRKTKKALNGVEAVFHLASQVGVGQSMYQIQKYVSHNLEGTAVLLDLIVNFQNKVKKIILASSMTAYGEGAYDCSECGKVYPSLRSNKQLKKKQWGMLCPKCSKEIKPIATPEDKPLNPASIYASTKRSQEEMCLRVGLTYKIPTVALRYFNAYGPRQSLNNPYTGVTAIFLSRVKNNKNPLIFEDGKQSRDFIYVSDITEANIQALKNDRANYDFFNVGAGAPHSILDIAKTVISISGKKLKPEMPGSFRAADVRHCYSDISKMTNRLGFKPRISFTEGIKKLNTWSQSVEAQDLTETAQAQLKKKGLSG